MAEKACFTLLVGVTVQMDNSLAVVVAVPEITIKLNDMAVPAITASFVCGSRFTIRAR